MSDQDVEHPTRELSHDTGHTSELETESALVGTLRLMEVPRSEQDDSNPPTSHEQSYPPQVVPVSEQRPLGSGEVFEREQIEAALTYQAEPSQLQSAPHERPELPSTTSRAQPTALDNSIPASKPSPAEDEHMCLTSVPSEPAALSITALASTPSAAKDESVQSTSTDLDVHLSSELSELTPLSVAASASVTTAAPDEQMPSTSTENLDMHLPSEQTQPTPLSVEALASIPTAAHDELMSSPSTDLDMHFPSEQAEPTPLSVETPASVTIAAHDEQMPSPSTDLDMHLFSEPTEPATLSVAALAPITTAAQDEQMTSPSTDLDLDLSSGQTDPATLSVEAQASVATAAHDEQMPSTDLDMHLPSEQTDPATLSVEAPASVASAAHDEQMLSPSTDLDMHLLSERTEPATLSLAALASIPTVAQDEQTSLPSTDSESTPGSVAGSVLVPGQNEQLHESNPTTQPASESVAAPTQGSRQRPEQSLRNEGVNTTRQRSTIRFTFRQQGESTGRTNSASSNVSHPQVQEFHRFREEQRRLQLLAAERRAAMNGWHNSSDGDLQASVTPPAEAAETRTRNAATSATNSASAGVEGAVAEGAVGQEIVDTAATAATGRAGSGNVRRITIRGNPAGQSIAIIQNNSGDQSVLMPQLPGVAHRTLRVAPGARHFTVPVGAGANIQIRGAASQQAQNNYSNNPNAIPRVPIPRLEAQVIPISTHDLAASANENEDEQHDHYRCTICYEFFVDPSSCGQCSSRFCHACLLRVASSRSSNNPSSSKCPGCRAILTVEDIVRDETLGEELKAANLQVLCSYRGCDQRLPSASMKEHEQSCGYMPMRCKNATMGCSWNGLRKDLAHHLSNHCALEQVAGFVEQYRQSRADHQAAIIALQRSQTMNTQLTEVNSGLMRRSLPSPTNIFDVLNLIYTSSCTTSYFLFTADIWRLFLVQQGAQESRALVCNFLYMLPTILNVARTAVGGYRLLLTLNVEQDLQAWVGNMELGVLSITPFLLLLTAGLCFLLDGQSSMKWSHYKYFGLWERKVLRDLATLAFMLINVVVIECDDSGSAALFLWMCVLVTTCCFPPIILTTLGLASGIAEPNPHQIVSAGRSACVLLFALRHAAVASFLGIAPALDAAILSQLLRRNLTFVVRYDLVPVSDGIWSSLSSNYMYAFLGCRCAMWFIESRLGALPWLTVIATVSLLVVNFLVHQMTRLGITIGILVYREGRSNVLPNQLGVRNAFTFAGTLSFCIWSSLLLVLAVTF